MAVFTLPPSSGTKRFNHVVSSLMLSMFPLISAVIAPGLLIWLPQGRELLNMVNDAMVTMAHPDRLMHFILFQAALFAWGTANWYGSRILLQYRSNLTPPAAQQDRFVEWWNRWLPRVLGIAGMALIAFYITTIQHQYAAGGLTVVVTVFFGIFIIYRRRLFHVTSAPTERDRLLTGDRVSIWLAMSLSVVLFVGLTSYNFSLARFLGAPVILLLSLGCIVLVGSVILTYMPLSWGRPSLAWLPLVLAMLWSAKELNRNHGIAPRLLPDDSASQTTRPTAEDDFAQWLKSLPEGSHIVLVAAEGGASRSAWWTAHVLAALDYASNRDFGKHVYAISGVSGGSLGAATYVSLLAARAEASSTPGQPLPLKFPAQQDCWAMRAARDTYPMPMQAECFVGRDSVSTVLGYLLFPDLLQRFVFFPVSSWDRSLGLEQTWQLDWNHLFGGLDGNTRRTSGAIFSESLQSLYFSSGTVRAQLPLLFLNSMRAGSGRSVLQSPVSIRSTELDDIFAPGLHTQGLRLSAAVHNSARFPLVSPGGEVETSEEKYWDSLVDGGYFENSGAATLSELVRALSRCKRDPHNNSKCVADPVLSPAMMARIHILFIMNDPVSDLALVRPPSANTVAPQGERPIAYDELLTPLVGLYNSRSARADSSKRALYTLLDERPEQVTEIFLSRGLLAAKEAPCEDENDAVEPAMSWQLNPVSREAMWRAVGRGKNREALCTLLIKLGADDSQCARLDDFARCDDKREAR